MTALANPQILGIETILLDLPTIRPHVLAMATMHAQTICLVRLTCSDGIVGLGEATTIGGLAYGPEAPETIKTAIDTYFAPLLAGQDATRPAAAMALVARHVVGNHFAKCAIETALLDAQGKRLGLPVSELLGGRRVDSLPVLWTLASGDTARDIAEAEQMLDTRRHDAFKLKIGKRPIEQDVAHVGAIKAALGDRASVRVDVNMAWDEPTARRGLAMLADAGCDLVEQPIIRHNRDGMARLVALGLVPVMADESLTGPASAMDFARAAAADVFAVKIEQSGGLDAARAVAQIGDAACIGLYGGTMLEGAIGTIASAHAFATFPALKWGTELFGPLLLTEEILERPLTYADFSLEVPAGPGLGIALDEDRVEHFRRDRTATQFALQGA
ncbi:muconate and chloromuconate cycloisomerase (plasmid) [Novosphingobium aromaticivorans DSM 12444]|uniref:Muconate and chloromuconate cycloisomerase n=1 Tax=Novosphingobium aromaticivorans (strain ATCC 700278 / DSM 12444 / CCUG 56034 / CIP 105152 / NBRC 16084 / F199) TaxID=279238 RepID=A4XFH6_NOVAD|nr:muconate cycloisomerase family protein [Novosphingobium aromaticivorans]ABP64687.1 muconate and chloromuconate cycloisomerase [Novosphingobium aromaticivorans DSM 12444]SCY80577.1 muconate cycloisomerase [Novosphingobium aromaticivorans]